MNVEYVTATTADAEALATLRVNSMRPSLEAIGRFDPDRARNRFLDSFDPSATQKIVREGKLIGFFVVRLRDDHVYLDHLYIVSNEQGSGIGAKVIDDVKALARKHSLPIRLCALNGSASNGFYQRNGFQRVREDEFDTHYELPYSG